MPAVFYHGERHWTTEQNLPAAAGGRRAALRGVQPRRGSARAVADGRSGHRGGLHFVPAKVAAPAVAGRGVPHPQGDACARRQQLAVPRHTAVLAAQKSCPWNQFLPEIIARKPPIKSMLCKVFFEKSLKKTSVYRGEVGGPWKVLRSWLSPHDGALGPTLLAGKYGEPKRSQENGKAAPRYSPARRLPSPHRRRRPKPCAMPMRVRLMDRAARVPSLGRKFGLVLSVSPVRRSLRRLQFTPPRPQRRTAQPEPATDFAASHCRMRPETV